MKLFTLLGQNYYPYDPFWEFDRQSHFRPLLDKGSFYKLTGFDLAAYLIKPVEAMMKGLTHEIQRVKRLSYGQKVLYYWLRLRAAINNGGFIQFYSWDFEIYVPTIIKGLLYIGDGEMARLIQRVDSIYQKKRKLFVLSRAKDLFASEFYEKLAILTTYDDQFYGLSKNTLSIMESFARKHPGEFFLNEDGAEIDPRFTGLQSTYYVNGQVKDRYQLIKGQTTGAFRSYYENGNLQELIRFKRGKQTGEKEEYYENGNLKFRSVLDREHEFYKQEWFYENGYPKKLEHLTKQEERIGEYKEWYDNGQLAFSEFYVSHYKRIGKCVEYYRDGHKKFEGEYLEDGFNPINYWDCEGTQLLCNGTGLYIRDYHELGENCYLHMEYRNFKLHGTYKYVMDGVIVSETEYKDGIRHGAHRSFYRNGNLESEVIFENGIEKSFKYFGIFENPYVATTIYCEMNDQILINRELETADVYPIAINKDELAENFHVDLSLFDDYAQDQELRYSCLASIDVNGNVNQIRFLYADNTRILSEIKAFIGQLKFRPALKNNEAVPSYINVKFHFHITG